MLRHHGDLPLGHLDVVAEHAVVAHAQVADAGFFLFLRLDLCQRARAAGNNVAQAVELGVVALADQPAFAQGEGRLVHDGRRDERAQVGKIVQLLRQHAEQRRVQRGGFPERGQRVGRRENKGRGFEAL